MVNRGGSRIGAGRKKNQEPTVVKRIPQSLVLPLEQWLAEHKSVSATQPLSTPPASTSLASLPSLFSLPSLPSNALHFAPTMGTNRASATVRIPVFADKVQAGFPSPAEPHIANHIDFNTYLVRNASATFAVYADGDSMIDAGISAGDLLIVDRSANAKHKDIVLAEVDNAFTVKRYMHSPTGIALHPANASGKYPIITPNEHSEIRLVGVVTHIIKKV